MKKKARKAKTIKIPAMMKRIDDTSFFEKALEMNYTPSSLSANSRKSEAKLLIVTGGNATGKSFFSRLVHEYCRHYVSAKVEVLPITMSVRTSGGIHLAFMLHGAENSESTGVNSAWMLQGAFKTAKSRKHGVAIILDEPAIGLSESYCAAMGKFIAKQIKEMSANIKLVVLVSHSRVLIGSLVTSLFKKKARPHHVRFGDDFSLSQWLAGETPTKSINDLLKLPDKSIGVMRKIAKIIKN